MHAICIGSSPRLRGTLLCFARGPDKYRFIPASAGNTAMAPCHSSYRSVHPRVCGEHRLYRGQGCDGDGSSPRLRGTHVLAEGISETLRFIPASAGNTEVPGATPATPSVHPRVCGEHVGLKRYRRIRIGSSPRLRGTLLHGRRVFGGVRFIPASAGNTGAQSSPGNAPAVHPRVCGEHSKT